jgi:hypothetical protein
MRQLPVTIVHLQQRLHLHSCLRYQPLRRVRSRPRATEPPSASRLVAQTVRRGNGSLLPMTTTLRFRTDLDSVWMLWIPRGRYRVGDAVLIIRIRYVFELGNCVLSLTSSSCLLVQIFTFGGPPTPPGPVHRLIRTSVGYRLTVDASDPESDPEGAHRRVSRLTLLPSVVLYTKT